MFWGTVYCTSFRWMERLPGNGSLPGTRFLLAAKESSQRKLPLFRRSGPATKGLHAPWIPKEEVAEGAGYANAVLLFALNAHALCSDLKFGCSPEPPLPETAVRRGRACPARDLAMPPVSGQPPPTAKGASCCPPLPLSSATHLWQSVGAGHARPATLPLPPMCLLHRREGS